MQRINISQSYRDVLTEHAKNEEPNESCAMLFGRDGVVSEVFLTENITKSQSSFEISSEQLIQGYDTAKERGVDVVGIFHSHPNSEAYPSDTDRQFMRGNPVAWIIYSGINRDLRAYFLESEIVEIPIEG